jgi:hypothetical protein
MNDGPPHARAHTHKQTNMSLSAALYTPGLHGRIEGGEGGVEQLQLAAPVPDH